MIITFIGGGNMAAALLGGLLQQGTARGDIRVVEIAAEARARLERATGWRHSTSQPRRCRAAT